LEDHSYPGEVTEVFPKEEPPRFEESEPTNLNKPIILDLWFSSYSRSYIVHVWKIVKRPTFPGHSDSIIRDGWTETNPPDMAKIIISKTPLGRDATAGLFKSPHQ